MIWGAEGQRLISRIENATLNQVEEALGMNVKDFSSSDISATNLLKIENIRHKDNPERISIFTNIQMSCVWSQKQSLMESLCFINMIFLGRLTENYIMEFKDGDYQKRNIKYIMIEYIKLSKVQYIIFLFIAKSPVLINFILILKK